ncbi:MAG: UPF0280 family protein [Anaerohalosphaera sp.]|nr:UPF0280 family protein [Anaerohalosphaera sp.]
MSHKRIYREFVYREAVFRICCEQFDAVTEEIVAQRKILEDYIACDPVFQSSLVPVDIGVDAPLSAVRMAEAAKLVGVGPMAGVAGTMAQLGAEAAVRAGAEEVIVENGGDIYLLTTEKVVIALYAGADGKGDGLGFSILPANTPLAICSSSGKMGHSMSLGQCDLATVVSKDAALADAAATLAANLVSKDDDIEPTLNRILDIEGIDGVLIVNNGRIGMAGQLPPLVKVR